MLGLGVAVILGTNAALPAAAFADDPSASPSETSAEPTSEPSPPEEPTPTDPEPTTPPPDPDPDPTTPSPDPTDPDPDPEPTTPDPDPTSPGPDPTSPDPSPTTPGPSPTTPGTTPPPTGTDPTDPGAPPPGSTVAIKLSLSGTVASPGGTLTATTHIRAGKTAARDVRLTLSGSGFTVKQCTLWVPCKLGTVTSKGRSVPVTVHVPADARPGSQITVYATVTAAQSKPQTASVAFGVVDATALPTSLPPALPDEALPAAAANLPQVALPPVASPQLAPTLMVVSPVAALRHGSGDGGERTVLLRIAAVQAGWLAALLTSTSLVLLTLRLSPYRRTGTVVLGRALRVDRDVRARLNGKRPTAARLRTLPPLPAQPAGSRPRFRLAWLPPRPNPQVRHGAVGT